MLQLLVGFEPNATMNTAHHMLLYGCGEPGSDDPVWYVDCLLFIQQIDWNMNTIINYLSVLAIVVYRNCGEMASSDVDNEIESASPCHQGSHSQVNSN